MGQMVLQYVKVIGDDCSVKCAQHFCIALQDSVFIFNGIQEVFIKSCGLPTR